MENETQPETKKAQFLSFTCQLLSDNLFKKAIHSPSACAELACMQPQLSLCLSLLITMPDCILNNIEIVAWRQIAIRQT